MSSGLADVSDCDGACTDPLGVSDRLSAIVCAMSGPNSDSKSGKQLIELGGLEEGGKGRGEKRNGQ